MSAGIFSFQRNLRRECDLIAPRLIYSKVFIAKRTLEGFARLMMGFRSARRLASLAIFLTSLAAFAQGGQAPQSRQTANELVRRAVNKEVADMENPKDFWRYHLRKESASGSQTRDMVETKQGIVARTIAVNDQPLTPEQRAGDDARLAQLIADPQEQRKKQKEQNDETNRVLGLVRALPDALLYDFDGNEVVNGRNCTRLKFVPNPKFSPTTRETLVYKRTGGFLWVDTAAERFVRFDATLTDNVNIGWGGILGHINKGGHFVLGQTTVANGKWKLTTLILEATGKLLIFKNISLKQRQFGSDYKSVPPTLSIAEAVDLLKRAP